MPRRDEFIGGLHAVSAALTHGAVSSLYLPAEPRPARLKPLIAEARKRGINWQSVSAEQLQEWTGGARHQGVGAQLKPFPYANLDAVWALIQRPEAPLFLLLDQIQDPHNLGACLRSAECAGVSAVLLPNAASCMVTAAVREISCGAAERLPVVRVANLARCIGQLRKRMVWVYGAAAEGEANLYQCDWRLPSALVIGAEGRGLRPLTRRECDQLIRIPMAGQTASLNASVATGVCLFEAVRQRNGGA